MAESGIGKIELFDDFTGGEEILVAATTAPPMTVGNGAFSLVGQGLAETDSGAIFLDTDGLNGVLQLTTTDEDIHAAGLQTPIMFDVGLMGTIVAEAKVRQAAITTGEFFFGFSDVQTDLAIIEGAIGHAATTVLTLTASDICGFISAPELTAAAEVHAIFNGGTTTGVVLSTTNELNVNWVAGEYLILRVEMDTNGTARFYVNGALKKTVEGAVSTSVDLCLSLIIESKTTAVKTLDVDYLKVKANRDWTV